MKTYIIIAVHLNTLYCLFILHLLFPLDTWSNKWKHISLRGASEHNGCCVSNLANLVLVPPIQYWSALVMCCNCLLQNKKIYIIARCIWTRCLLRKYLPHNKRPSTNPPLDIYVVTTITKMENIYHCAVHLRSKYPIHLRRGLPTFHYWSALVMCCKYNL